jgi:pimeloyl-ACP methyl ester carboxylesterase
MPLSSPMHSHVASDGLKLSYALDDYSDPWRPRETLFLVHAAMGSARRLYKWVPILARDFRVVRPDMRGHGQTGIPGPDQLSLPRLAKDVIELADALGCRQFHIAGSSAGAIVAMQVAIDYPDRVKTLTNFASTPGLKNSLIDAEQWIARIKAMGMRGFLEQTIQDRLPKNADPGFQRWFIDESAKTNEELFYRFVRVMKAADQTDQLHRIRCPTLAVLPDPDPLATQEQYAVLKHRIPDCELVCYRDLPHNITDSVPERCATELRDFLRKHRA